LKEDDLNQLMTVVLCKYLSFMILCQIPSRVRTRQSVLAVNVELKKNKF